MPVAWNDGGEAPKFIVQEIPFWTQINADCQDFNLKQRTNRIIICGHRRALARRGWNMRLLVPHLMPVFPSPYLYRPGLGQGENLRPKFINNAPHKKYG